MISRHLPDSYALAVLQIVAHAGFALQFFYGNCYHWILSLLVYFFTGCFGMTMTYHRLLSHKSWPAPRWFEIFGTLCGTYGITGSSIAWVAVHREHHHHTDDDLDPHSPSHKGFLRVQWLSMFEKPNPKYAVHLIRDPFHAWIHKYYVILHITIAVSLLIINPMMLLALYLTPAAILWNAGSFINTLTHMVGYRNHDTKDDSTNVFLLGYLMWGEGWHNNHHNRPNSPRFGERWWEFDIGYFFIKHILK
jgi:fatty-acid desaturase